MLLVSLVIHGIVLMLPIPSDSPQPEDQKETVGTIQLAPFPPPSPTALPATPSPTLTLQPTPASPSPPAPVATPESSRSPQPTPLPQPIASSATPASPPASDVQRSLPPPPVPQPIQPLPLLPEELLEPVLPPAPTSFTPQPTLPEQPSSPEPTPTLTEIPAPILAQSEAQAKLQAFLAQLDTDETSFGQTYSLRDILELFGEPEQIEFFFDPNQEPKPKIIEYRLIPDQDPKQVFDDIITSNLVNLHGFELRQDGEYAGGEIYAVWRDNILIQYLHIVPLNSRSGTLMVIWSQHPQETE